MCFSPWGCKESGQSNFKGGLVFGFHEENAGTFVTADGRKYKHSGNTLVIGNGAGNGVAGNDGWAFYAYDEANPYISATTIDTTVTTQEEYNILLPIFMPLNGPHSH